MIESDIGTVQATEALKGALDGLVESLHQLRSAILKPGAVIQGVSYDMHLATPLEGEPCELLVRALSCWDMAEQSSNGSVPRFPGVYEVSEEVLERANIHNGQKQYFEDCIKALIESGIKPNKMRELYRRFGHAKIHPLQAWRQINVITVPSLSSISFTIAKFTESIETLSFDESIARLSRGNASDVIEQLIQMADSKAVRWHKPIATHVRANLVWGAKEQRLSRMLYASLPILLQEGNWPKRVRFNKPRQHAKRSDAKDARATIHLPFRDGAYLTVA